MSLIFSMIPMNYSNFYYTRRNNNRQLFFRVDLTRYYEEGNVDSIFSSLFDLFCCAICEFLNNEKQQIPQVTWN